MRKGTRLPVENMLPNYQLHSPEIGNWAKRNSSIITVYYGIYWRGFKHYNPLFTAWFANRYKFQLEKDVYVYYFKINQLSLSILTYRSKVSNIIVGFKYKYRIQITFRKFTSECR